MELTKEQKKFLEEEFGIESDNLSDLNYDCIKDIREKCFNIEVEEAAKSDDNGSDISERGKTAAQLVDATLSYSKSAKKVPA